MCAAYYKIGKDTALTRLIKVLVVDDSPTARQMLSHIVSKAADMRVVGEAHDGHQAVSMTEELRPDVILMDSVMPRMNGVQATQEIMHRVPTPIVIISASLESNDSESAFEAIKAGALTTLRKPVGPHHERYADEANGLLSTLRAMSGVTVIHHQRPDKPSGVKVALAGHTNGVAQIVGIVSSTGGPGALAEILKGLQGQFPLPIVIVQHMAPDFVPSLKLWLSSITSLKVSIANENDTPRAGQIYLAPGNKHLTLNSFGRFTFQLRTDNDVHVPSGDVFLASLSRVFQSRAIGVILTGMGSDGARGLRMMHDAGAFTIAQDAESCVVYGMPKEAVEHAAVTQVVPLSNISEILISLTTLGDSHGHKAHHTHR
jgi:two-component system, chemotaxis family, protein-glutamate methylesterase/glutaminase